MFRFNFSGGGPKTSVPTTKPAAAAATTDDPDQEIEFDPAATAALSSLEAAGHPVRFEAVRDADGGPIRVTAVSEGGAQPAPAPSESAPDAAAAERARIKTIVDSEEGRKRPRAAQALAMTAGLSAEAAIETLAAMPPEATGGGLGERMEKEAPNPEVGAGGGGGGDESPAAFMLATAETFNV